MASESFEADVADVVSDIYGISKRPKLGPTPTNAKAVAPDLSAAASAVVEYLVKASKDGQEHDPHLELDQLKSAIGMTDEDLTDALDELEELGCIYVTPFGGVGSRPQMFTRFDQYWKPWVPAADAVTVARCVHEHSEKAANAAEIAEKLGWDARRLNPALFYLTDRDLVMWSESYSDPFLTHWIQSTDKTRRFLKEAAGALVGSNG